MEIKCKCDRDPRLQGIMRTSYSDDPASDHLFYFSLKVDEQIPVVFYAGLNRTDAAALIEELKKFVEASK